ncbi:MAG: hypothetical protein KGI57_02295 [Hyphomicrobiales bacterium]|nr:hypothetical protein [Hyphomicrobiales bacterium]MDE2016516.1 hypothetical protein [Hyphomicrobiales bacterium]
MFKSLVLAAVGAIALASVARAAVPVMAGRGAEASIVKVAEGCGPGGWRGPRGACHPFRTRFHGACPRGMHLGPHRRRCWPNRY